MAAYKAAVDPGSAVKSFPFFILAMVRWYPIDLRLALKLCAVNERYAHAFIWASGITQATFTKLDSLSKSPEKATRGRDEWREEMLSIYMHLMFGQSQSIKL